MALVDEHWQALHNSAALGAEPGQTYVAVFDVLGFRDFVEHKSLREAIIALGSKVHDAVQAASYRGWYSDGTPAEETKRCDAITFSDTIVLYTPDDSPASFHNILAGAGFLMGDAMGWGVPLRGGITCGELCVFGNKSVVVGRGLVKAYDLQAKQNWAGAILDPDLDLARLGVEQFIAPLENTELLVRYPAPLKKTRAREALCVGWNHRHRFTDEQIMTSFQTSATRLPRHAKRKLRATLAFARFCRQVKA